MAVQLARRRVRKLNAEGDFTVEEFEVICEQYGNACLRCGDRESLLTPDHVVPLSLGGSNLTENIQPLCGDCNSWKNVKVIDYRPDKVLAESSTPHAGFVASWDSKSSRERGK